MIMSRRSFILFSIFTCKIILQREIFYFNFFHSYLYNVTCDSLMLFLHSKTNAHRILNSIRTCYFVFSIWFFSLSFLWFWIQFLVFICIRNILFPFIFFCCCFHFSFFSTNIFVSSSFSDVYLYICFSSSKSNSDKKII